MEERRSSGRQLSCIPASFDSQNETDDLALIRDVSVKGARLFTRTEVPVGERVTLHLYFGKEGEAPGTASGRIVRADRREPPLSEVWLWELGVEFDEPITAYEAEIQELSEHQAAEGVLKR